MEKQYYWAITPRDHDPIYVTEQRAQAATRRLLKGEPHIVLLEGAFPTGGMRIEPTNKVIPPEDEQRLVESGEIDMLSHDVLTRINEDGVEVVRWKWAKKSISAKQMGPGCYKLGGDYNNIVVGFKLPLTQNQILPPGVEWCGLLDIERLDRWAGTLPMSTRPKDMPSDASTGPATAVDPQSDISSHVHVWKVEERPVRVDSEPRQLVGGHVAQYTGTGAVFTVKVCEECEETQYIDYKKQ